MSQKIQMQIKIVLPINRISPQRLKNQDQIKVLLNDMDVVINVESWAQISSACVSAKLKPWKTLNYSVWDTVKQMQSLKEFKSVFEMVRF